MGRKKKEIVIEPIDPKEIGLKPASEMTDGEIDAELKSIKLERERIGLQRDTLQQMEKERALCTISKALATFNNFLVEFRDAMVAIPDDVQKIVPSLSPSQYTELRELIDVYLRRLHEKTITLTLEDTRTEAEKASEITKAYRRKANILAGRTQDDDGD